MRCRLKVITPLHIGSGLRIPRSGYVINGGRFHRVDLERLFEGLEERGYTGDRLLEMFREIEERGEWPSDLKSMAARYTDYSLKHDQDFIGRAREVNEIIKSAGKFYVPGSSIKGSILSAIHWFALKRVSEVPRGRKEVEDILLGYRRKGAREHLLERVLGEITGQSSDSRFARWISVTDSNLVGSECAAVVSGNVLGGRRAVNLSYEVVVPGCEFEVEIKCLGSKLSEKEILGITDDFYSRILEEEKSWIERTRVTAELGEIEDKKYKIRIGQGSSSLSTSLLVLAKELGGRVCERYLREWRVARGREGPKTRKLVNYMGRRWMMGWCALQPVS
ncbi:MAG: hypothetical protein APU95_02980 [Hadesarchaea archaeon YNP_N21]|nr:MAG: hypothetical protein APU95_02980 [Hadesarchaea archaeon YNP_N21]